MKPDSAWNAVNVSTSIIAANAWIQKPIVSIELSVVFGRCQEIGGRRTRRWEDSKMGRGRDREIGG
jgi:hypothetical protein